MILIYQSYIILLYQVFIDFESAVKYGIYEIDVRV